MRPSTCRRSGGPLTVACASICIAALALDRADPAPPITSSGPALLLAFGAMAALLIMITSPAMSGGSGSSGRSISAVPRVRRHSWPMRWLPRGNALATTFTKIITYPSPLRWLNLHPCDPAAVGETANCYGNSHPKPLGHLPPRKATMVNLNSPGRSGHKKP
jgi:hypothetical protein